MGQNQDHVLAHKHSSKHRSELERSAVCGCFYCFSIFNPAEIVEWIDDGQTAICPKCPSDSIIGSASGYPITAEFLKRMHDYWFFRATQSALLPGIRGVSSEVGYGWHSSFEEAALETI